MISPIKFTTLILYQFRQEAQLTDDLSAIRFIIIGSHIGYTVQEVHSLTVLLNRKQFCTITFYSYDFVSIQIVPSISNKIPVLREKRMKRSEDLFLFLMWLLAS